MSSVMIAIGQRVCDKDGFRATIMYLGPVATSKSRETIYAGAPPSAGPANGSRKSAILSAVHLFAALLNTYYIFSGLEWDAAGRGKNDGAVVADDGTEIRYFRYGRAPAAAAIVWRHRLRAALMSL